MRPSALLFMPLALAACSAADPNARETSTEKAEWSILQAAEYKSRGTLLAKPEVQKIEGYELLVAPSLDNTNIWIMLNPKAPPYYKQVPNARVSLSKTYVEKLRQTSNVGYTTGVVLNHLADKQ